jgi:hypothetical protein
VFDLAFDLQDYDYISNNLMELVPGDRQARDRAHGRAAPARHAHPLRAQRRHRRRGRDQQGRRRAGLDPGGPPRFVEDVVVLPALDGQLDDQVYYVVRRTINGATVRYLEKWAQESSARAAR